MRLCDFVFFVVGAAAFFCVPLGLSATDLPQHARIQNLPNSQTAIATWTEAGQSHFAIKRAGNQWQFSGATSFAVQTRFSEFDPAINTPEVPLHLAASESNSTYIVQFETQTLDEYRTAIQQLGGTVYKYLPNHSYIVDLDPVAVAAVQQLPFVRWVGNLEPTFKLEQTLLAETFVDAGPPSRVNIMVLERGLRQKNLVVKRIAELGGKVDLVTPSGYRLEATLSGAQLAEIARMSEVMWVDRWSPPEVDMDKARDIGGANYIETVAGFSGQGVRGEVMDTNLFDHGDFNAVPPVFHGPRAGSDDHGTGTFGIVFGSGAGNSAARGMIPDAQGIFSDFGQLTDRYQHTEEILQAPYFGVFQSNSWGGARTFSYTSISAEMDDIIFLNDIAITQSQSNAGDQDSRPQAWAKNVVSVGGVNHNETLDRGDDFWSNASIGPASDGRVKPDLCHFYDSIFTVDDTTNGYRNFCCTSGATPIVAGHFGLFFQMWSEGIFGNEVQSSASVFENRSHAATAKAMLINTAHSYDFNGANHNLTRVHQGWGMPDVGQMYDLRDSVFVVDEEVILQNLESHVVELQVAAGEPEFRATMVYTDPMGVPFSATHRINDLSLRVTSPSGTVYWGNNGLLTGNSSTPGGSANTIDTVENVFVQSPEAGVWSVEVIASEVNEDSHLETAEVDADFALVVSGVQTVETVIALTSYDALRGVEKSGGLADLQESDDSYLKVDPGFTLNATEPPVWLIFNGSSNVGPGTLSMSVESSVNTPGLTQTVELFNFTTGLFENVASQSGSFNVDGTNTVDLTANIGDYIKPGGEITALVGWRQTGFTLVFPWTVCVDQVVFE